MVLAFYIFSILITLVAVFVAFMTVLPLIHGAPYVPSATYRLENMVKIAGVKKGQRMAELGSGDGKVMIAFAKQGVKVDGYEINPFLVWRSKAKIRKAGLADSTHVYWKSMWKVNYSKYDLLTIYGITHIMKDMEKKLQKELKPGTKVVSNYFTFPNWKPQKNLEGAVLYIK